MAKSVMLVAVVLLVLVVAPSPIRCDTAHDLLASYGLPKGLLPDAVKSYSLSDHADDDGGRSFEVQLRSSCYVHFPSNLVFYDATIRGKLSYGRISDLSGIEAKKLFIWVSVTGIVAHPDKDAVEFQVGFISESLPDSDFQSVPGCKSSAGCRGAAALLSASSF